MATITETRRDNLRALIEQHGGVSKLAKAMGYANPSFLSQMAGPKPSRQITEKSARKLEVALGLHPGALDGTGKVPEVKPTGNETACLVAEVIRLVGSACESENVTPSASKFADVVTLAYLDSIDHGGRPREDRVRQLARLLK
jgi:hypothetical protein